jgi:hypothetical protein
MSFQLPRRLAQKIERAGTRARGSELKLQGEVDGYLREYLKAFGIDYDPEVNKHLQISDYSTRGRPDSLFGHVILDYKAPDVLKTTAGLRKAKEQVVDDYLNPACSRSGTFDLFKEELERLENGDVFRDLGITNFLLFASILGKSCRPRRN